MVPRAVPTIILTASGEYDSVQCPFVSGSQGRGPRAPPPTPPASPPPPPHPPWLPAPPPPTPGAVLLLWLRINRHGCIATSLVSLTPPSPPPPPKVPQL